MELLIALLALFAVQSGVAVESPRIINDRWPSNYDAKSWAADMIPADVKTRSLTLEVVSK